MSEIKVADNAQEMVATFDHMKKQNGTVSAEEAATFRDQVSWTTAAYIKKLETTDQTK